MHWSYFNYNNLTHTLNEFKIPVKDHQVVHSVAADYVSVLKILRNIKDLLLGKMSQIVENEN